MSETIAGLWTRDKETINSKSLGQILMFSGSGKLNDNTSTSLEMREYFNLLPTEFVRKHINECLQNPFDGSGFALQDLVNELGKRLGFVVEHGLYRGNKNSIGHDGIWRAPDHDIVIEVKTTDAYSINIDTIASYRKKLIETKQIKSDAFSVLMVVGRQDTGGLEAQIRGSKHAWDIRLISIDALLKLLKLKEDLLDDENTFTHICQVLKPLEFTRLDYLIETIFVTGQDSQPMDEPETGDAERNAIPKEREKPVAFHESCITKIQQKLGIVLKKQTRTLYDNKENSIGITCSVSKDHGNETNSSYWFAFHPYQRDSLSKYRKAFACFGCGSDKTVFIFEYNQFLTLLDKMWMTKSEERQYWHIVIRQQGDRFLLARGEKDHVDITEKLLQA